VYVYVLLSVEVESDVPWGSDPFAEMAPGEVIAEKRRRGEPQFGASVPRTPEHARSRHSIVLRFVTD
jgi:hypothetical protein